MQLIKAKMNKKKWQITTSLISTKPQLKIGHAITSIKSTTVQQLKLDFTICRFIFVDFVKGNNNSSWQKNGFFFI